MSSKMNLKNRLQRGDITKIAEKTGLHINTVSRIVNGKTKTSREDILVTAIELIERRNEIIKKFTKAVE
jgi:plasmid maintenance system antidote protein VapI